jgi:hypothetical protein
MAHDNGFDVLERVTRLLDLLVETVDLGISFARRDIIHWSPVFLHLIMAAGFEEKETSSGMFDEDSVNDHLDTSVFGLRIACGSHVLVSSCKQKVGINVQRSQIEELMSAEN